MEPPLALAIEERDGDDAGYLVRVGETVAGMLASRGIDEAYVIRVDNWFDRKWLKFTGMRTMDYREVLPKVVLERYRALRLTWPPFSPHRIEDCAHLRWQGSAPGVGHGHYRRLSHAEASDLGSRGHRDVGGHPSLAFVWYTGNTARNGRGSLMAHVAKEGRTEAWYASLSRDKRWSPRPVRGISEERIEGFAVRGRRMVPGPGEPVPRESGASVGETPLHVATRADDHRTVRLLLEAGADANGKDAFGQTPLHRACQLGSTKIAQLLIEHGARVGARDKNRGTPLFHAAFRGQIAAIETLHAAGASVNARNKWRLTPLAAARHEKHHEAVAVLRRLGAHE